MPRAKHVCTEPGCPELTTTGRCTQHRAQQDRARGNRHARGYDSTYVTARTAALAGAETCQTCGEPFTPDNPATGGHTVPQREGGTTAHGIKAECRRCNYGWRKTGT